MPYFIMYPAILLLWMLMVTILATPIFLAILWLANRSSPISGLDIPATIITLMVISVYVAFALGAMTDLGILKQ